MQVNLFIFQDSDLLRFLNRVLHFAVSIVAESIAAIDSQANMHFPEASQPTTTPSIFEVFKMLQVASSHLDSKRYFSVRI